MLGELWPQANLQGLWHLNANLNDSSGNGYNLTDHSSSAVAGLFGSGGRDFEKSSNQYADIADASCPNLEISGAQTWLCWLRPETLSSYQAPMAKTKSDNTVTHRFLISTDGGGVVYWRLDGTSATQIDSGGVASAILANGVKGMIVGTYDGSTMKVFVNGNLGRASASTGSASDTNGNFALGRNGSASGGGEDYDGVLDEAAIFNRAWSEQEVRRWFGWGRGLLL